MPDQEMPDIAATMSAAYDAAQARDESAERADPGDDAVDVETGPEEAAEASDAGDEEISDQGDAPEDEPAVDDASASLDPPTRWSADDKAAFAALPREAQELVLKRERDVESHLSKRTQEIADQGKRYQAIEQMLEPRRQAFAMDGLDDVGAIRQLLALSDHAARDPAGFINWFAQARGVALDSPNQPEADEASDPEISALKNELNQIRNELQGSKQRQQQEEHQANVRMIDEFEAAKTEKGEPAHPYFSDVRAHMGALLQSGTASDLADAYEQAVWANPKTRALLMEQKTKSDQAQIIAQRKAKAAAAEKAASARPRAANGQFQEVKGKSIEDTMSAVYDQLNG